MTTMTECEHGDDASTCPPCNRRRPRPFGRTLIAKYAGGCDGCPEPVRPGQPIRMNGDEIRHEECI